ncbi:hypothetical protein [Dyella flagellata]|uniref:hypothetical protein n=1 Tax=Dyella flagellata TaxID=1867833 RepID=UPI0024E11093|nr:hypothetical protein [Dyella flagellata]
MDQRISSVSVRPLLNGGSSPTIDAALFNCLEEIEKECQFRVSAWHRSAMCEVLGLAARLEDDPLLLAAWYQTAPIAELNDLTAMELVSQGMATAVMRFLRSIQSGERS